MSKLNVQGLLITPFEKDSQSIGKLYRHGQKKVKNNPKSRIITTKNNQNIYIPKS